MIAADGPLREQHGRSLQDQVLPRNSNNECQLSGTYRKRAYVRVASGVHAPLAAVLSYKIS